jgi:hypothetical protein
MIQTNKDLYPLAPLPIIISAGLQSNRQLMGRKIGIIGRDLPEDFTWRRQYNISIIPDYFIF